ncbi:unnamed protein product [Moneuplotes crassus]|uniref:Uncharacterized protein n=1 Tax=Euplotes crassus TaxID=5936 RepID=A0AAD2D4L6_EUPCR|nr:unnamed protein product [Moneuplotes crassus]
MPKPTTKSLTILPDHLLQPHKSCPTSSLSVRTLPLLLALQPTLQQAASFLGLAARRSIIIKNLEVCSQ